MPQVMQPSFSKGEIAPDLHGRVDTVAYRTGLTTARNATVHTYGGVSKRDGTRFIAPVKDHTAAPRLITFKFKTTDTYILEFGNLYMRVLRDGGHVLETAVNISGATQANPVVVTTSTSHSYTTGDEVYITGVVGMTELNGNRYTITVTAADKFSIAHQVTGVDIDGTAFTAYSSAGTSAKVFEITTPYLTADLFELNHTQSADIMTITHREYDPYELSRTGHDAWSLDILSLGPVIGTPADMIVTVNTTGTVTDRYRVTATDRETSEEGLPGLNDVEKVISGATQANPVVITATSHGFADGDEVQIDNVVGMTELNGNRYTVTNQATNTFELFDNNAGAIDGTGFTAYSSAGIARQTFVEVTNNATTRDATIAWTVVPNAGVYSVYRRDNGIYGFIGQTELATFEDENIDPDTTQSHQVSRDPFADASDFPGCVGYFAQRRVFGGSLNKPDTSEFSQTGNQYNFNVTRPVQADDAITATLSAREVNEIRHYVQQNSLLALTAGSEWLIDSGQESAFSPSTIQQKPQSHWGTSYVKPITLGNSVIYVTFNGTGIRNLGYSFDVDGYTGSNLALISQHLLNSFFIVDMANIRSPESVIYLVRNDGVLLTLSYEVEQEVIAWTHWDTDGKFEACATYPLGGAVDLTGHSHSHTEDAVYFVVKRTINGSTVRYIEATMNRHFDDIQDAFFVDAGLSYDEPKKITGATAADPVVITATAHGFSDGDEVDINEVEWVSTTDSNFNEVQPDQLNNNRYTVANKTANTFELSGVDGSAFDAYIEGGLARKAVITVSGLDHLEGKAVACLADGNVISNLTVSGGSVTLARKFSRIHIGLPYTTDIETLPLSTIDKPVAGVLKKIDFVTVKFLKSRGLFYGTNKDDLTEMKQREFEVIGAPTAPFTGDKRLRFSGEWELESRIFLRNHYPLPLTILNITPSFHIGDE